MTRMSMIVNALKASGGTVTEGVLKIGWVAYPNNGTHKVNCCAIAYPVLMAVGAVDYTEGGTVDGRACYDVRRADGACGAVAVDMSTGKGRVWWFDGKGAAANARAMYRHNRKHLAFMPHYGEVLATTADTYATANDGLNNVHLRARGVAVTL